MLRDFVYAIASLSQLLEESDQKFQKCDPPPYPASTHSINLRGIEEKRAIAIALLDSSYPIP
ncbi:MULTISPECIES: hypothetical protein [Cyanophyceae]|uniref:hypothetical protein n=1 Tax=Cyanophyceae TaxID=3028117 RepID=UPI001685B00F|nr:hypothetical protein [Trichocoleus sp. FACHB-69]MBD1931753.1 hypothetical protein [Trichocoleus sp. FACHB-69]